MGGINRSIIAACHSVSEIDSEGSLYCEASLDKKLHWQRVSGATSSQVQVHGATVLHYVVIATICVYFSCKFNHCTVQVLCMLYNFPDLYILAKFIHAPFVISSNGRSIQKSKSINTTVHKYHVTSKSPELKERKH